MADLQYIKFNTIFHPWTADYFCQAFDVIEASDQPIIPIEINSPGGYVVALQTILDRISSSKKIIATYSTGNACSCGAGLAMAGSDGYRFIAPNAEFMIHQPSGFSWGKSADIEASARDINKMADRFVYSLCDKAAKKPSGYTKGLIKDNFNADLSFFAEEAVKAGFFDAIGTISGLKDLDILQDLLKQEAEYYN